MEKIVFVRLALPQAVHEIRDLLECEERNGQWQENGADIPLRAKNRIDVIHKKVGVFIVGKRGQVCADTQYQHALLAPEIVTAQRLTNGEIEDD